MKQGLFISFEGNDGAGKTTVAAMIQDRLEKEGWPVLLTREPGGSGTAEKIREILLSTGAEPIEPKSEALLFAASRHQHVAHTIKPALAQGKIVLSDRFLDSSLAYQGMGRELGMETIEALNDFALQGFRPDLTLFLQVDPAIGASRIASRGNANRLDLESEAFSARVRQGFDLLAKQHPERIVPIDSNGSLEQTVDACWSVIQNRLSQMQDVEPEQMTHSQPEHENKKKEDSGSFGSSAAPDRRESQ